MRTINAAAEDLIKSYEELRLVPYDDATPNKVLRPGAKIAGTLTVGWGHTGPDVVVGKSISLLLAQEYFNADIADTTQMIEGAVTVPLTDNQFGALSSLAFNIGNQAFLDSTLVRLLNQGEFGAIPREIAKWNKTTVGGKLIESAGLVRRRASEANLWAATGEPDVLNANEAGNQVGETAAEKTKATDPVVAGGVVAGGAAILSDAARQLQPLIDYSATLKWLFLAISIAAIGVVIFTRIRAIQHEAS